MPHSCIHSMCLHKRPHKKWTLIYIPFCLYS